MQADGGAGPKRLFDLSREGERRLQRSTPRAPGPRAGTASRRSIQGALRIRRSGRGRCAGSLQSRYARLTRPRTTTEHAAGSARENNTRSGCTRRVLPDVPAGTRQVAAWPQPDLCNLTYGAARLARGWPMFYLIAASSIMGDYHLLNLNNELS